MEPKAIDCSTLEVTITLTHPGVSPLYSLVRAVAVITFVSTLAVEAGQGTDAPTPAGNRVEEILSQLEARSEGLTDIRCRVTFVEDDRINLSKRTKHGSILFLIKNPNPLFLIHFDRTETEDGLLGKQEWYLFDGHWLYQAVERIRQVTKQEVVRPGQKIDLFDLENSPFPLPFGQKKQKILKNFNVTLAAPRAGDPENTDHLVCMPKSESHLRDKYQKLEFFVRRDIHLPSRIIVTKSNGLEINTADFPDLADQSINTGVSMNDFERPAAWRKYKLVVEALDAGGE